MRSFFAKIGQSGNNISRQVKQNKAMFIWLACCYIAGVLIGVFFKKPLTVEMFYIEYANKYYTAVFSIKSGMFSLFLTRAMYNAIYICVIGLFSLTMYLAFCNFFIIFYRGFVLGVVCVIIFKSYSVNGIVISLLVLLPQSLIITFFLILGIIGAVNAAKSNCNRLSGYVLELFIIYLLTLLGALYEFILVVLIIRPINFMF